MATLIKKAVQQVETVKYEIGETIKWITGAYYDGRDWGWNENNGEIIKLNPKTVTVKDVNGNIWRVKYSEIKQGQSGRPSYIHVNKNEINMIQELKQKEVLTADEAKMLMEADSKWASKYLFERVWDSTYLNLNVYSEVEHHERQFRMEVGI